MIILDDKHISEFGFLVEPDFEDPITPYFDRKTMSIPGRAGIWDFGSERREKPFLYHLKIIDRYHDNMQQAFNKLVAFLLDDFGYPREVKLVREYEPDKFYKVKLIDRLLPERLIDESNLILPLVADDSFKYANVTADELYWGSEVVTFEYHYLLGHEGSAGSVSINGPQTIDISVDGLAVQPVFEIEGTAQSLKVECGDYSFTLPNFVNEKWEIDFKRYVVFRNGQETMIEIRDFFLMPGSNAIKITGNNINIDLRIKFRDKYN